MIKNHASKHILGFITSLIRVNLNVDTYLVPINPVYHVAKVFSSVFICSW
jgi:hypothetical protein